LHGGFSGSLVLKTDSYGLDSSPDEPSVTKLDNAVAMLEEYTRTLEFTKHVGASAAKMERGLFLVDTSCELIEESKSTEEDVGCFVRDMVAGACWVSTLGTELIPTFKQHAAQSDFEIDTDAMAVIQQLWGAGGPLRALALKTCRRSETLATRPTGLIECTLQDIITMLILTFRVPNDAEGADLAEGYSMPVLLDRCINKVLESRPNWLEAQLARRDRANIFKNSLVHDCDAAVWRDEDTCKALVGLIEQLESLLKPTHPTLLTGPTWLADYKPLRMHQHGDLSRGNILIDARNSLQLIDFARAGEHDLCRDAAKMVSVILFEQFPVPLTLDDIRRGGPQKLVGALGAREEEATDLSRLVVECDSKAALVERLAAGGSLQRFLPFIEDTAVAEQRAKEACDVIDLLFMPGVDDKQSQLWEMGERQPPADWPAYAQLALQLCTRVLKVTTELVVDCSRREQGLGEAVKEDLHPINFSIQLLLMALCTTRYVQCGAWQKRVAWHTAQRMAGVLSQLLRQPPLPLPASADRGIIGSA
jgi:hypothetical protein